MKTTRKLLKHNQRVSKKKKKFTLNKIRGGFWWKKKKEPVPPTYIRMYVPWLFHWMSYTLPRQLLENFTNKETGDAKNLFENLNGLEPCCLAQIRRSLFFHFKENKNTIDLSQLILNEIKNIKQYEYSQEGKLVQERKLVLEEQEEQLTQKVQKYCDLIIKIMGDSAYKLGIKDLGIIKRRSTLGLKDMVIANVPGTRKTTIKKSFFFPGRRQTLTRTSFNKKVENIKQKESNYDEPFKDFLILLSEDKQLEDRDHFSYDIIPPEMADLVKTSIKLLLEGSREEDINKILDKLLDNITPSGSVVNLIQHRRKVKRRKLFNDIPEETNAVQSSPTSTMGSEGVESSIKRTIRSAGVKYLHEGTIRSAGVKSSPTRTMGAEGVQSSQEVQSFPPRTLMLEEVQSSSEGDINLGEVQSFPKRTMTLEKVKSRPKGTIRKSGIIKLQPGFYETMVGGSGNTPLTLHSLVKPKTLTREENIYGFCMSVANKNYKVTLQIITSETGDPIINVLEIELLKKIKYNKTDIRIVKKSLIESKDWLKEKVKEPTVKETTVKQTGGSKTPIPVTDHILQLILLSSIEFVYGLIICLIDWAGAEQDNITIIVNWDNNSDKKNNRLTVGNFEKVLTQQPIIPPTNLFCRKLSNIISKATKKESEINMLGKTEEWWTAHNPLVRLDLLGLLVDYRHLIKKFVDIKNKPYKEDSHLFLFLEIDCIRKKYQKKDYILVSHNQNDELPHKIIGLTFQGNPISREEEIFEKLSTETEV